MSKNDPTGPVIVVVDDDHRQVRRIQGALEDAGFRTRLFTSAESALRHIVTAPPSAVILGAETFGLTCVELVDKTNEALGEKSPPFVLLGGVEDARYRRRIAAPTALEEIVKTIHELAPIPPPTPVVAPAIVAPVMTPTPTDRPLRPWEVRPPPRPYST